jgi:hypothetical protein
MTGNACAALDAYRVIVNNYGYGRLREGFRLKDLVLVGTMLRLAARRALTELSWLVASDGMRRSRSSKTGCDKVRRDD